MATCFKCKKECRPQHYRIMLHNTSGLKLKNVDVCSEECASSLINSYCEHYSELIYEMQEQEIKRLR